MSLGTGTLGSSTYVGDFFFGDAIGGDVSETDARSLSLSLSLSLSSVGRNALRPSSRRRVPTSSSSLSLAASLSLDSTSVRRFTTAALRRRVPFASRSGDGDGEFERIVFRSPRIVDSSSGIVVISPRRRRGIDRYASSDACEARDAPYDGDGAREAYCPREVACGGDDEKRRARLGSAAPTGSSTERDAR